ncbi:hypothetical protein V5799_027412, partial [Amblyomma americanum]
MRSRAYTVTPIKLLNFSFLVTETCKVTAALLASRSLHRGANSQRSMSPVIVQDACWTIPVVAACAAFFTMLTSSSSGLLYVLFMDEFDISHEEAAWPVSVQAAVGNSM